MRLDTASGGGEDYELLFTVRPAHHGRLRDVRQRIGNLPVTRIGVVTKGRRLLVTTAGSHRAASPMGFEHFRLMALIISASTVAEGAGDGIAMVGFVFLYEVGYLRFAPGRPRPVRGSIGACAGARHLVHGDRLLQGHDDRIGRQRRTGIAARDPAILPGRQRREGRRPARRNTTVSTPSWTPAPKVQGRALDLYMWSCHEALALRTAADGGHRAAARLGPRGQRRRAWSIDSFAAARPHARQPRRRLPRARARGHLEEGAAAVSLEALTMQRAPLRSHPCSSEAHSVRLAQSELPAPPAAPARGGGSLKIRPRRHLQLFDRAGCLRPPSLRDSETALRTSV